MAIVIKYYSACDSKIYAILLNLLETRGTIAQGLFDTVKKRDVLAGAERHDMGTGESV